MTGLSDIETEGALDAAIRDYGTGQGAGIGARELEANLTPRMSPGLLSVFNSAARIELYRRKLRTGKTNGLNTYISIKEGLYKHQMVLTFDEWETLAVQTAASGQASVIKLRLIGERCLEQTGRPLDVNALIASIAAA